MNKCSTAYERFPDDQRKPFETLNKIFQKYQLATLFINYHAHPKNIDEK